MKYIFTESQIKKIIDNQLNEQVSTRSYEGTIDSVAPNGMATITRRSEMGNEKIIKVQLKVKLNVQKPMPVHISELGNGQYEIWGGNPSKKLN